MAESTLSANSARPRDSKRAYSAAVSTCAGTPSSMAASTVQRPSPESETRPAKPASEGSLRQRLGRQVQQLRGDDAAAAPHFGYRRHIEGVLKQARLGERRGLGILAALVIQADVGVLEDVEAFGVGRHQAVLDAVVDHFHEVAAAVAAAVQIALRGRAVGGALARADGRASRPGPGWRKSDPDAQRCPARRRSSGSSRAPGPGHRRWCPHPRNAAWTSRADRRAGCHRDNGNCRHR